MIRTLGFTAAVVLHSIIPTIRCVAIRIHFRAETMEITADVVAVEFMMADRNLAVIG
jgi:hypothetical protein